MLAEFAAYVLCRAYSVLGNPSLYKAAPNSPSRSLSRLQLRLPPTLLLVSLRRTLPKFAVDIFHIAKR